MVFHGSLPVVTHRRSHWVDITAAVQRLITSSGVLEGVCCVFSMHTTAGISLNENADPDVQTDLFRKLSQLIPQRDGYAHAEGNSDSHLKTMLTGLSVQVPVTKGKMVLGTWQSLYLCEFDGPRERTVAVTVMGEG